MLTPENIDFVSLEKDIHKIHNKLKNDKSGKNASYIPALAKVDPSLYAISICMIDGTIINVGDVTTKFAIKYVKDKIGKLSSEEAFNSICAIEKTEGHTINSFNNSGALATLSLLDSITPNKTTFENKVIKNMSKFAGKQLFVNEKIFGSEFSHSEHNLAIAYLLKSYNRFYGDIEDCVDVYTKQCSTMVTSDDIAIMASTLANFGKNPVRNVAPRFLLLDSKSKVSGKGVPC